MTTVESGWIQVGIALAVWFGTVVYAWGKFGARIDMLDLRMKNMEETNKLIAETLREFNKNETDIVLLKSQMATVAATIATQAETLEALRRGEGFIVGPRRGNIEGEWPSRRG